MPSSEGIGISTEGFFEALLDDDPQDLYDDAPCGFLSTSPDGTIVKVNRTLLTWTGYGSADLVGRRRLPEILTAGGRIFYETHIAPMLRMQGVARELAVEIRCADGRRLPVLLNAVVRRDARGEPIVVRVAVFDATERRAYEQELLAARQRAEASEARARQLARTLQASLMPPTLPAVPHLELSGAYRPAGDGTEVGGDFYDVFEANDGSWTLVIGDVCGKGPDAAVVTSLARHTIRAATYAKHRPLDVLATLNGVLLRDSPERFCTVGYARVWPSAGHTVCRVVSAGHLLPVVASPSGARDVGASGTALGIVADVDLTEVEITLGPGELLAMFTDGCTEARDADGAFFGDERVRASLRAPHGDPATALCDEVTAFQGGRPRDDIAVVVARPA